MHELPPEYPKIALEAVNLQSLTAFRKTKPTIPNYINPQLAYLAGALRDGTISRTKGPYGTKYYLAICNKDKIWLDSVIRPTIETIFNIKLGKTLKDRQKHQIRVTKYGIVQFLADLFQHPYGKQTLWKIPNVIEDSHKEIKRWFLRGFYDSEGGCGNITKLYKKYPWHSTFPIRFHSGWTNEKECPPLGSIRHMLTEDFDIKCSPVIFSKRYKTGRYKTQVKMFYVKITDKEQKLKFVETIGSSNPTKLKELLFLKGLLLKAEPHNQRVTADRSRTDALKIS